MLFNSWMFVALVILTMFAYYAPVVRRWQLYVLLTASFIFYAYDRNKVLEKVKLSAAIEKCDARIFAFLKTGISEVLDKSAIAVIGNYLFCVPGSRLLVNRKDPACIGPRNVPRRVHKHGEKPAFERGFRGHAFRQPVRQFSPIHFGEGPPVHRQKEQRFVGFFHNRPVVQHIHADYDKCQEDEKRGQRENDKFPLQFPDHVFSSKE